MNLNNYLAKNEQKILFFLLIAGFMGISFQVVSVNKEKSVSEHFEKIADTSTFIKYELNTVRTEELLTIPGIGEVKAEAIIEYIEKNKPVAVDDLININGIGPKTLEKIKEYIYADND